MPSAFRPMQVRCHRFHVCGVRYGFGLRVTLEVTFTDAFAIF